MLKIRKAVIPAAGLGTRFLPATKAMAKEMMPVVDTPSIQFVVKEALDSGIEDILIITGKGKNAIEDHFDSNFALEHNLREKKKEKLLQIVEATTIPSIHYVRQPYPLGLGNAILQARTFVGDEPFVVLLGDDIMLNDEPLTKSLLDIAEKYNQGVVATIRVPKDATNRFGIIDIEEQIESNVFKVNHLIEKPSPEIAPSDLGIIGRYILHPEVFDILENLEPDEGNEIQLTDALEKLNEQEPLLAYEYTGTRYDVGDKYGMLLANIEMGLQHEETAEKLRNFIIEYTRTNK